MLLPLNTDVAHTQVLTLFVFAWGLIDILKLLVGALFQLAASVVKDYYQFREDCRTSSRRSQGEQQPSRTPDVTPLSLIQRPVAQGE